MVDDDGVETVVQVREPQARSAARARPAATTDDDGVRASRARPASRPRSSAAAKAATPGRRRPPIITEAEFLARRESVDRIDGRAAGRRAHPDRRARGRRARRALRRRRSSAIVRRQRLPRQGAERAAVAWRPRSSTSARAATPCSTPARSTATPARLDGPPARIEQALKSGQSVLVQVTKDPIGHKGARLTSQVSPARPLPGLRARRLDDRHQPQAARHRARPAEDHPQEDRPRGRRRHRAHRRRGRERGRAAPRRRAAAGAVGGHREEGADRVSAPRCSTASRT